jgi:hypothetical protein
MMKPSQIDEGGKILQQLAKEWRELVAGSEGFLTESGSFWLKVVGEVAEKRRRVPLEHRDIEADSCAGNPDQSTMAHNDQAKGWEVHDVWDEAISD